MVVWLADEKQVVSVEGINDQLLIQPKWGSTNYI